MKNNPKKIRLTIEMDVDIDAEKYPDITEEEIRRAVVIQDSDVIDGFEITTNHRHYDNTCDFFLSNGVIVKKELLSAEEHRQEVDETTDMITTEDVVEQAVYMANAPDCCADEHAENMLGMLGANIVDTEIYHDENECPKRSVVCKASFQRKVSSIDEAPGIAEDGTSCVITDRIELPQNVFENFAQNLLEDYDFIADCADRYKFDEDGAKCLLVLGEGHTDGILVVTEGFHYARYTSHIPNAREIFDFDEINELGQDESPKLTM